MTEPQTSPESGYGSLERVPNSVLQQMMDYGGWASEVTRGRQDWRIPSMIADQWAVRGFGVIGTNEFARRFSVSRRTVCQYLQRLTRAGVIRPLGLTHDAQTMYAPCLERAAGWRARMEERCHGL